MNISILAVGKLRPFYREACDDYVARIRRYAEIKEHEIREGRGSDGATIERDEAARLKEKVPARAILVALAREGQGVEQCRFGSAAGALAGGRPAAGVCDRRVHRT